MEGTSHTRRYWQASFIVLVVLLVGATTALSLDAAAAAPPNRAAAASSTALKACVIPKEWQHVCILPATKAAWQEKYHCTFCAVTMDDLKVALRNASPSLLNTIFNQLNGHMVEYGLDSPARLMNFFAQVEAETLGGSPDWITERDNYSVKQLHLAHYFRSHPASACEYGRLEASHTRQIAACKALDPTGKHPGWWAPHAANQRMIANHMYDEVNGNHSFPSDDGWNYRGRGLLQVTGRTNYGNEATLYNELYHPAKPVDFVKNPELLGEDDYAFAASVAYWLGNGVEKAADTTDFTGPCPASDAVTKEVNGGGASAKTKQDRCNNLKNLIKNGVFGEVNCHLPATPGPGQPPGVPLPPSPPMPPLPPEQPPGSSPPVGIAAQRAQPAPPRSSGH